MDTPFNREKIFSIYPAMAQKTSPRLSTKIISPIIRSLLVKRSHLVERLRLGMTRKLSLVIAPAGYGKTTLLGEWLASISKEDWQTAWLSLDDDDNNPLRFWNYVTDALVSVNPEWQFELPKMGENPGDGLEHQVIASWINQINDNPTDFSLILDDYHTIQSDNIHKDLSYLINRMPPHMHLVIASRIKPKFPIAELRVKNQLIEINASDLSFSAIESETFLREVMGLKLTPEEIGVLIRATEGWVAGLQMAALSIKNQPDANQWIKRFSDSQSYIFDYLTEAVVEIQDEAIQDFLLKTSILTELSAPLCDYVLDRNDSCNMLEYLDSTNLFITPLRQERDWYRYHALFADVLKVRLERKVPQAISNLNLRACTWLRENGFPEKAIPHAVSAGHPEFAANIIESCAMKALGQSDFITFKRWIGFLPDDLLRQRPLLWIYSAMTEVTLWNLDNAKAMLDKIKSILCESELDEKISPGQVNFHRQISALQTVIDAQSKNADNRVVKAMHVMNDLSEVDLYTYGWFNHFIGYAYEDAGNLEAAEASFARSVEFVLQHNIPSGVISFCEIGRILKIQGRLREAERKYRQALDYAIRGGLAKELIIFAQWGLGEVLIEQNQLNIIDQWAWDIETYLPDAKIDQYGRLFAMELYFRLANYYLFRDLEKSKFYLQKIRREFQEKKPFFFFQLLTDLQVKIWLTKGDLSAAHGWVEKKIGILESGKKLSLAEEIGLARIFLAQDKIDAAYPLLEECEARALTSGYGEKLIEAQILRALVLNIQGKANQSIELFIKTLTMTEPEGYIRIYVNEGKQVQTLLSKTLSILNKRSDPKHTLPTPTYLEKLLTAFYHSPQFSRFIGTSKPLKPSVFSPLVEPLSDRELEVLTLLKNGKSGREIAKLLVVSNNTVKVHIRNIYQKLEVHNRREALKRANEYNLIN
ncbi:MAG: hypothetical protein JW908_13430 [Anaerolineales bacterium]|nr:hypothetical protein [Anaerolineales bacterium]